MDERERKIIEQYEKVFKNGAIINCGRIECMKLMDLLSKEYEDVSFGNVRTGFLDIKMVEKYINKIKGGS